MSIEQALLARARPYMLAAKARAILREEVSKGCCGELADRPVALEPRYAPLPGAEFGPDAGALHHCVPEDPCAAQELLRLQVWLSPQQHCDWNRSELFVKQLACVRHRVALEILGNQDHIALQLLCRQADLPAVHAAFSGQFEQCRLTVAEEQTLRDIPSEAWQGAVFRDFYPPPPYSHLLTSPDELKRSPYATVIAALAGVPPPAVGFYQVVFAPVPPEHNWHRNVQTLLDLEFSVKLLGGPSNPYRYA